MKIKKQLKYYDAEIAFTPTFASDPNPVLFEFVDFCYQAGLEAGFSKKQLNTYFTEKISAYYNSEGEE